MSLTLTWQEEDYFDQLIDALRDGQRSWPIIVTVAEPDYDLTPEPPPDPYALPENVLAKFGKPLGPDSKRIVWACMNLAVEIGEFTRQQVADKAASSNRQTNNLLLMMQYRDMVEVVGHTGHGGANIYRWIA